ncbi:Glycoside hydrolase family 13 protein [Mycena indigotica]|uniref:alpha-amylase n=1 Tax=Mycena indigotica TaxID=2126181 RepID=A0A8H6RXS3_9AGAR|nr:Glycoside hydrolase family 13 protein [Mycena indigotica]KAF7288876.1 Glycoside hydrolase family 13 protein [Mycena indigotica]
MQPERPVCDALSCSLAAMRVSQLLFLISPAPSLAASAADWATRSIYQLVTDRFALPSSSASVPCDTGNRTFCGGSWTGITNHLDYIQSMGFDAIWISPIATNVEGTAYGDGYHGYWSLDIDTPSPRFGTAGDLKKLSKALHERGMYLMLDVVVNHFAAPPLKSTPTSTLSAPSSISTTSPEYAASAADLILNYTNLAPFSSPTDFHQPCFIIDYTNQSDVEQCWLGDPSLPLPDLNTEDNDVQQRMYSWVKTMVKEYDADGVRIDTVKHVRKDFWRGFSDSAGVFTLGEVLTDNATYVASYIGDAVDAVLEYPAWYALITAFASTNGNLSALLATPSLNTLAASTTSLNGSAALTASFLENHDQPRFPSLTSDTALLMNAMVWPFVADGIPILYYGQEQGYQGAVDPSNREALWLSGYRSDKPLVAHVTSLNAARKLAMAGNKTFLERRSQWLPQPDPSSIMLSKHPLLALLTNIGAGTNSTAQPRWRIPAGTYPANTTLVDVLACERVQIGSNATADTTIYATGGLPKVLLPATMLHKNGGACPALAMGKSDAVRIRSWLSAIVTVVAVVAVGVLGIS